MMAQPEGHGLPFALHSHSPFLFAICKFNFDNVCQEEWIAEFHSYAFSFSHCFPLPKPKLSFSEGIVLVVTDIATRHTSPPRFKSVQRLHRTLQR